MMGVEIVPQVSWQRVDSDVLSEESTECLGLPLTSTELSRPHDHEFHENLSFRHVLFHEKLIF